MPRGAMVAQHAAAQTKGSPERKVKSDVSGRPAHRPVMERGFAKDVVAGERSVAKGTAMKKIYERPTLVKQGRLTSVTAQIVASGIILGQ